MLIVQQPPFNNQRVEKLCLAYSQRITLRLILYCSFFLYIDRTLRFLNL
jgi:hypothetical protein